MSNPHQSRQQNNKPHMHFQGAQRCHELNSTQNLQQQVHYQRVQGLSLLVFKWVLSQPLVTRVHNSKQRLYCIQCWECRHNLTSLTKCCSNPTDQQISTLGVSLYYGAILPAAGANPCFANHVHSRKQTHKSLCACHKQMQAPRLSVTHY